MNVIVLETCSCGASIEYRSFQDYEAKKFVEEWRKTHRHTQPVWPEQGAPALAQKPPVGDYEPMPDLGIEMVTAADE